jgi:hypothetical protein
LLKSFLTFVEGLEPDLDPLLPETSEPDLEYIISNRQHLLLFVFEMGADLVIVQVPLPI